MTPAQKTETIVTLAAAAIALIFAILDLSGKWPNNLCYLTLSALSVFEACTGWNKNRKIAILELVAAAVLALSAFN